VIAARAWGELQSRSVELRRARLAIPVALALLLVTGLAWSATPAPCFSPRVGEILSARLASHTFDGALPVGWTIEEVTVAPDHIELGVVDAAKHPHGVTLRVAGRAEDAVDGRGRSLVFAIDTRGVPIDDAGRQGLLELAARVDAAIPDEETRRALPERQALSGSQLWLSAGCVFYAIAIAAALVAAWRSTRYLGSADAIAPAVLTLIALGVRFFARAGMGDTRDVLGAVVGDGFRQRAGWSAFLRLLFLWLPARYETIWTVHRVVGALAVPLLYAALRQRFPQRSIAAAGATALAVVPLVARFSASDTPYVPLCTAFLGSVVALTRFRQSGSRGALAVGLILLTAAMQLRPDGLWLVVPAAILVLSVPCVAAGRAFSGATLVGAALFAIANLIPSVWALSGHNKIGDGSLGAYTSTNFILVGTLRGSPWTDLAMSPWPLSLLVLGGVAVAARSGRAGVGWLTATLVAMPLDFPATNQYANARYHLPAVYLACGLAGLGTAYLVERVARRLPAQLDPLVVAATLVLVAALPRLDLLRRQWTPQEEFDFYRAGVARFDRGCEIVALTHGPDAGFVPSSDPEVRAPTDIDAFLQDPPPASSTCLVYYRAANCRSADAAGLPNGAAFDENPACRELERRATLLPVTEANLRARPYRGERYSTDPVAVGFYRIVDLAPPRGAYAPPLRELDVEPPTAR
jgi:hypothetical protein